MKYRNEKLEPYVEGEAYFEIDVNWNRCWRNAQGQIHREDGPAIESANGSKCWYFQGKCHREYGPAVEGPDGSEWWYVEGRLYTEKGYEAGLEAYFIRTGKKSRLTLQREAEEEKRREYWRTVEMPGEYTYIEL